MFRRRNILHHLFPAGRNRLTGLAALLLALPLAGQAQPPELSDTIYLPGDAAVGPAPGAQHQPDIARGGDGYLAVWVDERTLLTEVFNFTSGPYRTHSLGSMWDIYAARLDGDGNLIDTTPIIVAQQVLNQNFPEVAWNGENWLVVWSSQAVSDQFGNIRIHIHGARVSPNGQLLDAPPIVIDTAETMDGLYWPTVASDGANWLVVWRDLDSDAGIYTLDGARVAPNGAVLDPGGVHVRHDDVNSYPTDPDLIFVQDSYFLFWTEGAGDINGRRIATDLTLEPLFLVNTLSSAGGLPDAATDGTDLFVVWVEGSIPAYSQIRGSRVTYAGQSLDPAGIEISPASGDAYAPAIDWDGSQYVVAYERNLFPLDIHAALVTSGGQVTMNEIPVDVGSHQSRQPAVAGLAGGGARVLWSDESNGGPSAGDIFSATVLDDGGVGPGESVANGAPRQTEPRFARSGDGYAAIYRSEDSGGARILMSRMDAAGLPIDAEPIEIVSGGFNIVHPSIAWNGSLYLAVWATDVDSFDEQIWGRRISAGGAMIDPDPVALFTGSWPDVAAQGDLFLVVGSYLAQEHLRRAQGVRVQGSDGAILDPSPITLGSNYGINPRVAAVGDRWIATWERHPTHDNPTGYAEGALVTTAGTMTAFLDISTGVGYNAVPASAGDTAVVVFRAAGNNAPDIHMRRILSDGTFLDAGDATLSSAYNGQYLPDIAWDGNQFVSVYTDLRNTNLLDAPRDDIYATRAASDGAILDPAGFAVAADSLPESQPAVTGGGGLALLGGAIFRAEAPFTAYRIGYRRMGNLPSAVGDPSTLARSLAAHPNPSAGPSRIALQLKRAGGTQVRVYDVSGAVVRRVHSGVLPAGRTDLNWDGRDAAGRPLAPGVYFIRAATPDGIRSVKLLRR
ncbi:MAG: T9SS type A sorting domain-containing protein [Candidatus Eisenbacteria bacterium]|nr:T9SS type A sorting domain-containing protein [Candidatus Eisenbacteria bacterium]